MLLPDREALNHLVREGGTVSSILRPMLLWNALWPLMGLRYAGEGECGAQFRGCFCPDFAAAGPVTDLSMETRATSRGGQPALKRLFQRGLRRMHLWLARRDLLPRMALYLHSLDPAEQPVLRAMLQWCRDNRRALVDAEQCLSPDCPGGAVYVSFDDNHRGWHEAIPLFTEFGVRVTFYTNTCVLRGISTEEEIRRYYDLVDHHGRREPLTVEEIAAIHKAGHIVGAHTHSHVAMRKVPWEQAGADLDRNRGILQEITGAKVEHFSYPFGVRRHFFNDKLKEDTRDWYAQDRDGNVWYFGEAVANYKDGKLVNYTGTWEAGVHGAKPGIVMPANPMVGLKYQQEHAKGKAEDMGGFRVSCEAQHHHRALRADALRIKMRRP